MYEDETTLRASLKVHSFCGGSCWCAQELARGASDRISAPTTSVTHAPECDPCIVDDGVSAEPARRIVDAENGADATLPLTGNTATPSSAEVSFAG